MNYIFVAFCLDSTANKFDAASYQVGILYPKQNSSTLVITLIIPNITLELQHFKYESNDFPNIPSGNSNILFTQCNSFPDIDNSNSLFIYCNSFPQKINIFVIKTSKNINKQKETFNIQN